MILGNTLLPQIDCSQGTNLLQTSLGTNILGREAEEQDVLKIVDSSLVCLKIIDDAWK